MKCPDCDSNLTMKQRTTWEYSRSGDFEDSDPELFNQWEVWVCEDCGADWN